MLVNSQQVCLLPVRIFNHATVCSFALFVSSFQMVSLALRSPIGHLRYLFITLIILFPLKLPVSQAMETTHKPDCKTLKSQATGCHSLFILIIIIIIMLLGYYCSFSAGHSGELSTYMYKRFFPYGTYYIYNYLFQAKR